MPFLRSDPSPALRQAQVRRCVWDCHPTVWGNDKVHLGAVDDPFAEIEALLDDRSAAFFQGGHNFLIVRSEGGGGLDVLHDLLRVVTAGDVGRDGHGEVVEERFAHREHAGFGRGHAFGLLVQGRRGPSGEHAAARCDFHADDAQVLL